LRWVIFVKEDWIYKRSLKPTRGDLRGVFFSLIRLAEKSSLSSFDEAGYRVTYL